MDNKEAAEAKATAEAQAKADKEAQAKADANTKKAEADGQVLTVEDALEAGYFGKLPDRGDIPEDINEYSQEEARKALYEKGEASF